MDPQIAGVVQAADTASAGALPRAADMSCDAGTVADCIREKARFCTSPCENTRFLMAIWLPS
jgi:hypothetical protein